MGKLLEKHAVPSKTARTSKHVCVSIMRERKKCLFTSVTIHMDSFLGELWSKSNISCKNNMQIELLGNFFVGTGESSM